MPRRTTLVGLAVALALIAIVAGKLSYVMLAERSPTFLSTDISGAGWGRALELNGHDGRRHTLADFKGKVVVVFFGFARCPDVCPTTLSELRRVMDGLGEDAAHVQVLFVTLDPERDTRQVLAQYVPAFHPRFLGLYGDAGETERVAREFKVYVARVQARAPGEYTLDHTAASYVFDPEGHLRLYVRDEELANLTTDIRTLLGRR